MRKKIFLITTILLFSVFTVTFSQETSRKSLRTLIIDPGHGGLDPGAMGLNESEANVALQVSLKLGDTLAKAFPAMKIIYTRTTDVLPGPIQNKDAALKYRANLANESGADLFIAIHCNSAGRHAGGWYERRVVGRTAHTKIVKKKKKTYYTYQYETVYVENKARGTETYIWATSKNDAKINSVSKNNEFSGEIDSTSTLTLPDPSDPTEKARMLIYAQYYFRKSLSLANYVQDEFKDANRIDRGVKQRNDKGIWVLQATGMPSILIEIGFISNKEEEEYLTSESGQKEIVSNIFTAIRKYKEKLESKSDDKKGF